MSTKTSFKFIVSFLLPAFLALNSRSQTSINQQYGQEQSRIKGGMIEIRSYNLKPGTRNEFDRLFLQKALPLLNKWNINVVAYGPSLHDSDSYFLVRSYKNLQDRQESEDSFYGSDDWRKGPREAILSLIVSYATIVLPHGAVSDLVNKIINMETLTTQQTDRAQLSKLNAKFIQNFINEDVHSHNEIIHKNFVCIESDGSVVDRDTYMKHWTTDFAKSGYTSFSYGDENIRIFGNMALVRSKTTYTKSVEGKQITGHSIYTDTYVKENGQWLCVQAHITPVKP